ncbi:MAG: type IV pilus twitching motility protein PilT [Actinobacteria bacterium]|nr:type IV pilus twitching motility protein PilT [Actinomycetota bacterium]
MGLGRTMPQTAPQERVSLSEESVSESAYERSSTEEKSQAEDISLPDVIDRMLELKASDLHFTAGSPPVVRVNGSLRRLDEYPVMDSGMIQRIIYGAISQSQRERFEEQLELDFSYSLPGKGRFRVNVYKQRDSLGAALRMIPYEIKTLDQLGMPPAMHEFPNLPRGFVLVTGPTGSGKSTTLAALVDEVNETRTDHIMTIEDPIEFLHKHKKCIVNQREVGSDTKSFGEALRRVLRQDPDIILVGELRDLETIQVALSAAETGHLVFATLHTQDAAQTVDRIIDVFPAHQQDQIRQQLAGALQGIVCQTLCKTSDRKGRVAATELLVMTPAIRNLVREGKTHQIYSALQAGAKFGMHTMDQNLAELVRNHRITYEVGLDKAHHIEDYNRLCGRVG